MQILSIVVTTVATASSCERDCPDKSAESRKKVKPPGSTKKERNASKI